MSARKKSIGPLLRRKKTYQSQERTLLSWCENWKVDQMSVINNLKLAINRNDFDEIHNLITILEGMTEKRFTALGNISNIVSDPSRELIDESKRPDCLQDNLNAPVSKTPKEACDEESTEEDIPDKERKRIFNPSDNDEQLDMVKEIKKCYQANMTLKDISALYNIGIHKVIKILVTSGIFTSETYDKIKDMRIDGIDDQTIAKTLGLSENAMNDYTPYKKGIYNLNVPSDNAKKIREFRERKNNM